MKQFAKLSLHNRKEQIKEEFHNLLNEAFSVKYAESDQNKESKDFAILLNALVQYIKQNYYINGVLNPDVDGALDYDNKDDDKKYKIKYENFQSNIDYIKSIGIFFLLSLSTEKAEGEVDPLKIIFNEDGTAEYSEIKLILPNSLDVFEIFGIGVLRHELFHLFQYINWKGIFSSNQNIYDNGQKYSIAEMDEELEVYRKKHGITSEEDKKKNPYFTMEIISWLCYYLNPLESQAFLQTAYQDYISVEKKNDKALKKKFNKFQYKNSILNRMHFLQEAIMSSDRIEIENITKKVIGKFINDILNVPIDSNNYLLKIYKELEKRSKKFIYKLEKLLYLAEIERNELLKNLEKDNIVTERIINESGKIIFYSTYLYNLSTFNFPLYESYLDLKAKLELYQRATRESKNL